MTTGERELMVDFDCAIIVDGGLSLSAQQQLSHLLDAHHQASIRTGLLILRDDRTDLGWLGAKNIVDKLDHDSVVWIDPSVSCRARLALITSPMLALVERAIPLKLRAEQAIIWPFEPMMALPFQEETGEQRSLAQQAPVLAQGISERLDTKVLWAPRTAGERHYLMQNAVGLTLTDWTWWPLLREDQEGRRRDGRGKGFVGRHWQGDAPLDPAAYGEFAATFGDCWPMDLAFHGDRSVLESLPPLDQSQGMELFDDEKQPLDAFLSNLALFVAVGDRETFSHVPFSMFEAMQEDVVVIASPVMSAIIDSPLPTAEPADLMGLACSLLSDDIALERARRQQRTFIAERHGARAHLARMAPYLTSTTPALPTLIRQKSREDRILFVSDDSPHLEHLTRELGIADHLPTSLKPHFVTTARNARLVEQRGYAVDYVPAHNSRPYREVFDDASSWNYWFERHLAGLISFTGARALVFDGVYPFGGVMANRKRFPNLPFAWIRQPLWRPGATRDALKHSPEFDLVIEPGDLAAPFDRGPLEALHHQILEIAPIRLDKPMTRASARKALGLGEDAAPAFLLDPTLPADKIEGETVAMLLDSLDRQGASLWTIDPAGASFSVPWSREVKRLDDPDAGKYRAAFDGAISASDYRSVHDQTAAGLPCILLAGLGSSTDDQAARAAFAEGEGFAIILGSNDIYAARAAADQLLDPARRSRMRAALARHETDNGAAMAALAIADLVYSVSMPKLSAVLG